MDTLQQSSAVTGIIQLANIKPIRLCVSYCCSTIRQKSVSIHALRDAPRRQREEADENEQRQTCLHTCCFNTV